MKILFNRICNKISGAEIYNLYLLKGLRVYKDLEITFTSDNEALIKRVKKMDIRSKGIIPGVNEIGTKKQFLLALFRLPVFYMRYSALFNQVGKQDLYVFESMTEKIFLTPVIKMSGKKVLWIEHGPLFETQRAEVIKFFYKLNSQLVDKIICVSKSTQNDLINGGMEKNKTIVMYLGIDTKEFIPLNINTIYRIKTKLHLENKSVIGFLGTVSKEKGIADFLDVATLLNKENNNRKFMVIGGGPLLEWAKHEVAKRNLFHNFNFTGFITDVKEPLSILDVLLFPSHHREGLSIALLEAHAMGIPCVASDIGGNSEIIIHGKSGFLYKNSSVNKVKELIVEVLKNKKTFKHNARKVALNSFSMKENSENFYQLFKLLYEN